MNKELILLIIVSVIWFVRLEIKVSNLTNGKRYVLLDKECPIGGRIRGIRDDGSLWYTIYEGTKMTYQKANAIKSLYPYLTMTDAQTGNEVSE